MKQLAEKHPAIIRWTHWINFPILFGMIYSGLMIYWAYPEFRVGWGKFTLFKVFPDWFNKPLGLEHHLAMGMAWHFFLAWVFAINGVAYVIYSIVSGEWRYLVPTWRNFGEAIQVALHDFHLIKKAPPQGRFNAAQRVTYTAIIVMALGSLLTGIAIYKPTEQSWLTTLLGGYRMARLEHFLLTIGFCAFFVVHIVQVIIAGWNNFRSMVTGCEITTQEEPHAERVNV